MNRILLGIAGFIMALALVGAAPGSAAADTYSLSIDASNGVLSWSGGNLSGDGFGFSQIIGQDADGNTTGIFTPALSGYVGNISFSTSGYNSKVTANASGSKGTLDTTFTGGKVFVTETKGTDTILLLSGEFDSGSFTVDSTWNKISSGHYNANITNVIGSFSAATLEGALTTFFQVSPDASGILQLDSWKLCGITSLTPQAELIGNVNGGVANIETTPADPVPIPGALVLFAPGLLGLVGLRKRLFG